MCSYNQLTELDVREVPILLDAVMNGERTVKDSVVRYADRADVVRLKMDDGVTLLPEEANPTQADPTPASPQPTTKPDDTKPTPKPVENPFVDVSNGDYFFDPVLWALNHDPRITDGTSATTFSPAAPCTRGQIVTFLYRDMK